MQVIINTVKTSKLQFYKKQLKYKYYVLVVDTFIYINIYIQNNNVLLFRMIIIIQCIDTTFFLADIKNFIFILCKIVYL